MKYMMTFWVLFVNDFSKNERYTKVYTAMMEAYNEMERINPSGSNPNMLTTVSRHSFRKRTKDFEKMNNEYFKQHGKYAF